MAEINEASPVRDLPGVGPAKREALARLGIEDVGDLLATAPRDYEDRRTVRRVADLAPGDRACVRLRVRKIESRATKKGLRITRADVEDDSADAREHALAVWFHRDWNARRLRPGAVFAAFAEVRRTFAGLELHVKEEDLDPAGKRLGLGGVRPIYPGTKGLRKGDLVRLVAQVLGQLPPDPVPHELRPAQLPDRPEALRRLHLPAVPEEAGPGRRRLAFDEFLGLRLLVEMLRADRAPRAHPRTGKRALLENGIESLPFSLTAAQETALAEIRSDLAAPVPMRRLLQGEVGSGKTVVSLLAGLSVLEEGESVAFVAPTEILAEQHFASAQSLLEPLGIRVSLLTSGTSETQREEILAAARAETPVFLVGTHALLEPDVVFHRLGLLVVDEQQRFGVGQRAALESKGDRPDLLLLTATPIPRTLARAVYGDLDVSTLRETPKTRAGVETIHLREAERARLMKPLREALARGERAFFVYPVIEETEDDDVRAAEVQVEKIAQAFHQEGVGLLTGPMPSREKSKVVRDFRAGKIQILVATSVIEVGIDIPEATLIVIEHAERFGLAALHQIRGRVGRGVKPGLAILTTPDELTPEGEARIAALLETKDGFAIAERDLALRGPGEFLGERQSGLSEIRLGRLGEDADLLEAATAAAKKILERDPKLELPAHAGLRPWVNRFFRRGKAGGVI